MWKLAIIMILKINKYRVWLVRGNGRLHMNSILDDQQLLVWNEGWGIDIFMNPLFKDFNFSGVGFSFAHYLYDFKHMALLREWEWCVQMNVILMNTKHMVSGGELDCLYDILGSGSDLRGRTDSLIYSSLVPRIMIRMCGSDITIWQSAVFNHHNFKLEWLVTSQWQVYPKFLRILSKYVDHVFIIKIVGYKDR